MIIKDPGLKNGYNLIYNIENIPFDDSKNLKMNFGILKLKPNEYYLINEKLEKAVLLMTGKVKIEWTSPKNNTNKTATIERESIWEQDPWALHVSQEYSIKIQCLDVESELAIMTTPNDVLFEPKLYTPSDCMSDERGKGTMRETSTRIVRTIFDDTNSPKAKLVLGEVINYPGKWSSYPPHWHAQPELYYYRFFPEQGFGFSMLGEGAEQVKNGDSILIFNEAHSQTSAPGYAMYYIWAIRHLEGNRYGPSTNTPEFDTKHLWVTDPQNEEKIFPPKK